MVETSLTAVLRERASLQPDDTAFTFVDYEQDWDGVAESVTWPQLYRQVCTIAEQLKLSLSPGDRAVILAPQGLDYVLAFLGALHAGVIAVPLSVPLGGVSDERVDSVIRDASPTAVLTTSSVVKSVASYFETEGGEFSAPLIEIDLLKQETPSRSAGDDPIEGAIAYLQYTSGSTRNPAGVMITHENLQTNYEQLIAGYFADRDGIPPFDSTLVSWLPLYHDMGLVLGVCAPILGGYS
ncbi:AMP-binding protein, partial [Mycolicibacterium agri]